MPETQSLTLTTEDGHSFAAFEALPDDPPKAAIVLVQEIFGLNNHIKAVTESFAAKGFAVLAPAYFDRIKPGFDVPYDADGIAAGRDIAMQLGWDGPLADTQTAMDRLSQYGRVGVVGYCWGGSIAWLAATRLQPAAAVGYYGGRIPDHKDETPHCPVMLHFGEDDQAIPLDKVKEVAEAQPSVRVHTYENAGHGFNCTERDDYDSDAAKLAMERTLDFLEKHLT